MLGIDFKCKLLVADVGLSPLIWPFCGGTVKVVKEFEYL